MQNILWNNTIQSNNYLYCLQTTLLIAILDYNMTDILSNHTKLQLHGNLSVI